MMVYSKHYKIVNFFRDPSQNSELDPYKASNYIKLAERNTTGIGALLRQLNLTSTQQERK